MAVKDLGIAKFSEADQWPNLTSCIVNSLLLPESLDSEVQLGINLAGEEGIIEGKQARMLWSLNAVDIEVERVVVLRRYSTA